MIKLFLIITIIFILILLYALIHSFKLNSSIVITFLCTLFIIQIISSPKLCMKATVSGAKLFFNAVFPSLFPFLVVCTLMIHFNGIKIYAKTFGKIICKPLKLPVECSIVIIISMLCGYPLGSKYTCDLYEARIIDLKTAERLLNIASNVSPLFVIGTVGTVMLDNTYLGYVLLLGCYLSCFVMSLILKNKTSPIKLTSEKMSTYRTPNLGIAIKDSIESSIKTSLSVGGFVVIFSVVTTILINSTFFNNLIMLISIGLHIPYNAIKGMSVGIIEITNGCNFISLSDLSITLKATLISFLISFSGISIISQVYSFTYKYPFSIKKYIKRKFLQGLICSTINAVLLNLPFINRTKQTFNSNFTNSSINIFILLLFMLLLPIGLWRLKKLFEIS